MTCIQFNYATFVQYYAQFKDSVAYPEQTLQLYWNKATTYVSNNLAARGLSPQQREEALNLLTAHLAVLYGQAASGQQTGLIQGATIDKISVQLTPPPLNNMWDWWLAQTQYGQQYLALMQIAAVGGFFVGGYPTTFSLRR